MERITGLFKFIWNLRFKIILTLLSAAVFFIALFPLNDLSDFITLQIAQQTNNQIYVQFDKIAMAAIPKPGIELENVFLETARSPVGIAIEQLKISPSIMSLILRKPAGSVALKGILKGDANVSLSSGTKTENGTERSRIKIQVAKMDLAGLSQIARLPMKFKGAINMEMNAQADLAFAEQPEADVLIEIDEFELPPSNMETMMGPLTLPDLKLKRVELKGRLANGRLDIEEMNVGQSGDEITGKIKGYVNMQLLNMDGAVIPNPGSYDLAIDLNMKKSFVDKASLFLGFIDKHKFPTADGARYAFKLSGSSFRGPPTFNPLR